MAHWVRASRADGSVIYVNTDCVWIMVPETLDGERVTVMYSTTVRLLADGTEIACMETVRQTPEELLSDELCV